MSRVAETYDWAGLLVRDYVFDRFSTDATIIDVGAGRGKYRILLRTYPNVDACEVWEPTVVAEGLHDLYRHVFVRDFVDLTGSSWWHDTDYDLVIMGDVLEHMTVDDAQRSLARIRGDVVVVVPFMYPQDEEHGNVYQRHIQDDLTPELMMVRYPSLQLVALETRSWRPFKGIYVRERECQTSAGSDSVS